MLKNEKILITGIGSPVAQALATSLIGDNEVWGVARFGDLAARARLETAGIKTLAVDVGSGDLSLLPTDFTYVLHLAYFRSSAPDFDQAFRVNGDGTGFVLHHCRAAKAALYMSSHVVYSMHDDPWHAPRENEAVGWSKPGFSVTSAVSKVAGEAVARYCARVFDLPVTIARLNAPYGAKERLLPVVHMDAVVAGNEVFARWDPEPYTPIHLDDMCDQLAAMLDAASVPATTVNWAGDEYVTVQQWCAYAAELAGTDAKVGVRIIEGSLRGSCADTTKRKSLTGPCRVSFKDGFREIYQTRHARRASGTS
jgi:nucleoside-diphosphate-sugar epimerase